MKSCAWVKSIGSVLVLLCTVTAAEPKSESKAPPRAEKKANLPSAREILERYARAIGGKEAFEKHQSQRATGTVEMPAQQIKGKMEIHAMRPNKISMKMEMEGVGEITTTFNGTNGWMNTAVTGPMLLEGKMLQQVATQADFDHALHAPENYTSMEVQGTEEFGGEECYKVKLVHKTGFESTEFFSIKSGLLKGFTATQESPFGPVTGTTLVSDYKKFGDLFMPAKITQKVSGMESVMTITEMEFDTVDPSVFEPPAAVKPLLENKP